MPPSTSTPSPPPRRGLFAWLRQWFGTTPDARATSPSPLPRTTTTPRTSPALPESDAELVAWFDAPSDAAAPTVEPEAVQAIAAALDAHFGGNVPEPSVAPTHALRVLGLLDDADVSTNQLVQLIAQDAAMTARILKVANSAFFRRSEDVDSLRRALTLIGHHAVSQVVIAVCGQSVGAFEGEATVPALESRWNAVRHHATTVSFTAGWLALHTPGARADRAALAGMLAEIGSPLALRSLVATWDAVSGPTLSDATLDAAIDSVQTRLGTELCIAWGFPDFVTDTCMKLRLDEVPHLESNQLAHMVRLASALDLLRIDPVRYAARASEALDSARALGLDRFRLQTLVGELRLNAAKVTTMFDLPDPADRT
jgi:HD-like signal output (HDOD) protein